METIKISQESLDDFNGGKKIIPAPFDDKNLCDDCLRDNIFRDFYQAADHKGRKSHLFGTACVDTDEIYFDGYIDVSWSSTSNFLRIELKACPAQEDFFSMREDFFRYYKRVFKEWENPDNEYLVVHFATDENTLFVGFYFKYE